MKRRTLAAGRHMRALRAALIVAIIVGAAVSAAPQRRSLKPLESRGGDWERYAISVPVSGGIRVGVMRQQPGRVDPRAVAVTLPSEAKPWLCVEISSRDGRYTGRLRYDLRGEPAGEVVLEVPTSRAGELSAYAAEELAILAALADGCDAAPAEFLVAAWRDPSPDDRTVVLLNSRVPTSIVRVSDGQAAPCADLGGVTVGFNLECELPSEWADSPAELVIRMRRGRSFASLPLAVRWP